MSRSPSRVLLLICAALAPAGCASRSSEALATSVPTAGAAQSPAPAAAAAPPAVPACAPTIAGLETLTAPIVLLGETHGTQEIPAAFAGLVCALGAQDPGRPLLVGLEIFSTAQEALDGYKLGDGGSAARAALLEHPFWQREYQDGRSSTAMLDLIEQLRRLRAQGRNLKVLAMDAAEATSATERDRRMADAVDRAIEAVRPARTLILVGDVHSRQLSGYPWDPNNPYRSVGSLLRERHGRVEGLRVMNAGGSAWTCISGNAGECGARPWKTREVPGAVPRLELQPEALAQSGWSGVLYMGTITASPPARSRP